MTAEIIGSAVIDGPDQTGKKVASLATLETLLDAGEISVNGEVLKQNEWGLLYTDFPQYFTPSGYLVRAMNRGGVREYKKFVETIDGPLTLEEEMSLRMSMYAMDRIFAWTVIDNIRKTTDKKLVHISDRSIHSNIVTIAYLLQEYGREDLIDTFYPFLLSADKALSQAWDWNLVTLTSGTQAGSFGNRAEMDDELEAQNRQKFIEDCYKRLSQDPNFGQRSVHTKDEHGDWRSPNEEAVDILRSVGIEVVSARQFIAAFHDPEEDMFTKMKDGLRRNAFYISPRLVIESLFPHFNLGYVDTNPLYRALSVLETNWHVAYVGNDRLFNRHLKGQERKTALGSIEAKLARILSIVMANSYAKDAVIDRLPPELIEAGRFLCEEYTGRRLIPFIRFMESKTNMPPGWSRFVTQVFMNKE